MIIYVSTFAQIILVITGLVLATAFLFYFVRKLFYKKKPTKREISRSEYRLREAERIANLGSWEYDFQTDKFVGSDYAREIAGIADDEKYKSDFEEVIQFIHPDDQQKFKNKIQEVYEKGVPFDLETRLIRPDNDIRHIHSKAELVSDESGMPQKIIGIFHDITEQKKAERKIEESERRWRALVEQNPQSVIICVGKQIEYVNQAGAELVGADYPEQIIGKTIEEFTASEMLGKAAKRRKALIVDREKISPTEYKIHALDGSEKIVTAYSVCVNYKGRDAIQTVLHDITDHKQKEQKIQDSLDEKKMLLKEIHHRVKNNLAVISGLLELQTMNTDDESTLDTLRDSQQRVHSIAMIHEKLYQSEVLSDIGFDVYLKELVNSISNTYNSGKRKIEINYDLEYAAIDLDQAIPCSLIVNEVIVNCYKHAFNGDGGRIDITSEVNGPELTIKIEDNGIGLSEDFDVEQHQSLGMTLIQTLAEQLGGEIAFESGGEGTRFILQFAKA